MYKIVLLMLLFFAVSLFAGKESEAVIGTWFTENKEAKVEIYKDGDTFSGKIIWLKEPKDANGNDKTDKHNPDESQRNRKMVGLKMMWDFEYDEDNVWEDGEIYDGKSGKTYSCKMTLSEDGKTLEVRGYIGFSLLGRTTVWTRAK